MGSIRKRNENYLKQNQKLNEMKKKISIKTQARALIE